MSFLLIDDKAHMDPRVVKAGNAAWGLFVRLADWSADQLTDGFIPDAIARMYATNRAEVARITSAGLWTPVTDPEPGFLIVDFTAGDGIVRSRSKDRVLADRRQAAERQRRHRDSATVTDVSRRDSTVSHDPPDQTRPDLSAVHDQTTTTTLHAPPLSSSSDLHGIDPDIVDATIRLVAEAVTVARNPARPRAFRHQVLTNLRTERATELAGLLAKGATAHEIAAIEAGGVVWADMALQNLSNGRPMEIAR